VPPKLMIGLQRRSFSSMELKKYLEEPKSMDIITRGSSFASFKKIPPKSQTAWPDTASIHVPILVTPRVKIGGQRKVIKDEEKWRKEEEEKRKLREAEEKRAAVELERQMALEKAQEERDLLKQQLNRKMEEEEQRLRDLSSTKEQLEASKKGTREIHVQTENFEDEKLTVTVLFCYC
jgi:cell shape-determining protein MreC